MHVALIDGNKSDLTPAAGSEVEDGKLEYGTMAYDNSNEWMKNQNSFGNTNWYDFYLKDVTTSQEHNFSLTGGDKGFTYYLSGNYMGQTGLFKYAKEKYDRYTINAKLGYKFNKYVTANWSTRYININNDKPSALNDLFYHNLGRCCLLYSGVDASTKRHASCTTRQTSSWSLSRTGSCTSSLTAVQRAILTLATSCL